MPTNAHHYFDGAGVLKRIPTIYELEGRRKKALALVAVIAQLGGGATQARAMNEEDWENAAKLAKLKRMPSPETRQMVIEALENGEVAR